MRKNVQDCSIRLIDAPKEFVLPDCLFSCDNLTNLSLQMLCSLRLPSKIYLPSLKHLGLDDVTFQNANSYQQLFSSPSLVELRISNCRWGHNRTLSMSAPNLKTLYITNFRTTKGDFCQVVIHKCNLHSFYISGVTLNNYSISNSSVERAELTLYCDRRVAHRLNKILNDLRAVHELIFRKVAKDVFEAGLRSTSLGLGLPIFHNMKHLEIGDLDINLLGKILRHTPHLQSLYLSKGLAASFGEENDQVFDPVPSCLFSSLIKITTFCWDEGQLFAVKNLLSCAAVLEQLEVGYSLDMREEDLRRDLLNNACGLKHCEVTLWRF